MKYVKMLGLLAACAGTMSAFATSASATVVAVTTGGEVQTPAIHAVSEGGHVQIANPIATISCGSTAEGKVESHGEEAPASGNLTSLSFTGCTNSWHVTANVAGTLSVNWTSGHNGNLYSSGAIVSTTRLGVTCNYETNNTPIGSVTGGNPATLNIEANIPLASGSSGLCGSGNAEWTGSYITTAALYVGLAGLNTEPDPVVFASVNSQKVVLISNPGVVPVKNLEVFVFGEGAYEASEKCTKKTLEPGGSCEEFVKCLKTGVKGSLLVSSSEPIVAASSELICPP